LFLARGDQKLGKCVEDALLRCIDVDVDWLVVSRFADAFLVVECKKMRRADSIRRYIVD